MDAPTSVHVMPSRVESPAISILVPICNTERYLEQCLDSLLEQSFANFEVLCINDGSTDASREIVQRYLESDVRFRVIDKPNSGYGASMNLGVENAVGRYVAILESDDFFDPHALELLYSAAETTGSDVVKANFWLYWSTPEERCEVFRVVDEGQAGRTMRPLDDPAIFFRKPSIWSALYRRDFLERWGIRFLETPGASYQDSGFNFKVWASAERTTLLEEPVLYYRQDNEKSSVNNPGKVFCVCDEYAAMGEFLDEHKAELETQRLWGILERMKLDSYLWNFDRLSGELKGEFVARVSDELSHDLREGKVDFSLFEPGARKDFETLALNPDLFVASRDKRYRGGALASLRRYLKLGGPALLAAVILDRARGTSFRRTDERGASL